MSKGKLHEAELLSSQGQAVAQLVERAGIVERNVRMQLRVITVLNHTVIWFEQCQEFEPRPTAEGGCARRHTISARPLWYRSLRSTYPTGVGGSPAAP
jgi:hypothetical protein